MKHVFIINPSAGNAEEVYDFRSRIVAAFTTLNKNYYLLVTEYPGHATELTRTLCGFFVNNEVRFYACGGGGTLFEVLNGIEDFTNTEVAMVPMGKNNSFLKAFDQSIDNFRNLSLLVRGKPVALDMLQINEKIYAANHVSFGHHSTIRDTMHKSPTLFARSFRPLLQRATFAFKHFLGTRKHLYSLDIDGEKTAQEVTMGVIMNGRAYAGKVLPNFLSSCTDGFVTTILLHKDNFFTPSPFMQLHTFVSKNTMQSAMTCCKGRSIRITRCDGEEILLNVDGNSLSVNALSINVLHGALRFIIPQHSSEAL